MKSNPQTFLLVLVLIFAFLGVGGAIYGWHQYNLQQAYMIGYQQNQPIDGSNQVNNDEILTKKDEMIIDDLQFKELTNSQASASVNQQNEHSQEITIDSSEKISPLEKYFGNLSPEAQAHVSPILLEIAKALQWDCSNCSDSNETRAPAVVFYRIGGDNFYYHNPYSGDYSDHIRLLKPLENQEIPEMILKVETVLYAHGYHAGFGSRIFDPEMRIYTNGIDIIGIVPDGWAYQIVQLGSVDAWQELERKQKESIVTNQVLSQVIQTSTRWTVQEVNTVYWSRHDQGFDGNIVLSMPLPEVISIQLGLESFSDKDQLKSQIEQILQNAGYYKDPIRSATRFGCGSQPEMTLYTDGTNVIQLANNDFSGSGGTPNPYLEISNLGSLSNFVSLENNKKPFMGLNLLKANEQFILNDPIKNPYAADERYLIEYYEISCEILQNYYYFSMENGQAKVISQIDTSGLESNKEAICQQWHQDPTFSNADLTFLDEHICMKKNAW